MIYWLGRRGGTPWDRLGGALPVNTMTTTITFIHFITSILYPFPVCEVYVCTSGGEEGCGPRCREVGRGSSSIGAKSQRYAGGGGSRVKSARASDSTNCAAHVVAHVGHVGQVADAATVAAVVGRVECGGLL